MPPKSCGRSRGSRGPSAADSSGPCAQSSTNEVGTPDPNQSPG